MSKLISDILTAPEPAFGNVVQDWESLSGRQGLDVRLALEIDAGLQQVLTSLGLDHRDTTDSELYHALASRAALDNDKLAQHIGVGEADSPEAMCRKVLVFVRTITDEQAIWAVKPSVIKRLLRAAPPKKLMKLGGQRSIDSVLKREPLGELLATAHVVELPVWTAKLRGAYKKLKASDFDYQKSEMQLISPKRLAALREHDIVIQQPVVPVRELGSCLIIPPRERFRGDVLLLTHLLLEAGREAQMYGTFYKALAGQPTFGEVFARTIGKGMQPVARQVFGIDWSVLHGLTARDDNPFAHDFGLGPDTDDVTVPSTAMILSEHLPDFSFWHGHFVGRGTPDGPVSCHLGDVIVNLANQAPYARRVSHYVQASLWDEFCARYLSHPAVAQKVLK